MHGQPITRNHQATCPYKGRKVPNRIVAACIDQRHAGARCQPLMPLALLWSAKKHKLCGSCFRDTFNQLEISVFAPLLRFPTTPSPGIKTDIGTRKIDAETL